MRLNRSLTVLSKKKAHISYSMPIGSQRLKDLVKDKKRIVIIANNHTRPIPSKLIAPMMLAEIRKGNKNIDVVFLVATSWFQMPTRDELVNKFGEYIVNNETIIIHDPHDQSKLIYAGKLSSECDFFINRLALETDLLVAEGIIEPHPLVLEHMRIMCNKLATTKKEHFTNYPSGNTKCGYEKFQTKWKCLYEGRSYRN